MSIQPRGALRSIRIALAVALLGALSVVSVARAQTATVTLVPNADYGWILTDPDGWTLYTWEGDTEGMSNCYDACADVWPPYIVSSDLVAPTRSDDTM